ncbi:DUF6449 domain-containing protein [Anaerosporobacter sp.]|uniref:DUF6449 domain-containing protein n=1 Tax=Anaerosporobacter sp. TaxID=1872529 RepID=UPI00286F5ED6|nr:DUF6449 domain-containing protein [Anaerosporobacter sp.]
MTSRNLLCRLMKEDMKRRLWAIAISVITFLFILPIYIATSLEQVRTSLIDWPGIIDKKELLIFRATECLSVENGFLVMLTVVIAVVCGISGFYYLQSKKKVDFYHSLPVKRETLFASSYLVGILVYVIPYIIALAISFVIAGMNGAFASEVWMMAWESFGVNVLNYVILYTVIIIAVLLTGQMLVSILASAVFMLYAPMLESLIRTLNGSYFNTYYQRREIISSALYRCSPISTYLIMIEELESEALQVSTVLLCLSAVIFLIMGAVWLYRKRMSEAAGKAISYKKLQPIIKTVICVPIGLGSGFVFTGLTATHTMFWLFFGMICGYLLCSFLMEIIYHFDFRAAFKSKIQLLVGAILMIGIFSVYKWDLLHYDQYAPAKDKIESMSIVLDGFDTDQGYSLSINPDDKKTILRLSKEEYAFEYMKLEDIDVAYEITQRAAKAEGKTAAERSSEGKYTSIYVQYRLHSGRHVYRQYMIPMDEYYDLLNQLYQSEEYKEGQFPLYKMEEVSYVACYNEFQELNITLSKEERAQLLAIYAEEFTKLSFDDIKAEVPLATLQFGYTDDKDVDFSYNAVVYPSFAKSIAFLTEHGFDFTKSFDLNNVQTIRISYTIPYEYRDKISEEEKYSEVDDKDARTSYSYVNDVTYNDRDTISKITPYLVSASYSGNNRMLTNYENYLSIVVVTNTDEYGNTMEVQYAIDVNNIPDFVKEDIKYIEVQE